MLSQVLRAVLKGRSGWTDLASKRRRPRPSRSWSDGNVRFISDQPNAIYPTNNWANSLEGDLGKDIA